MSLFRPTLYKDKLSDLDVGELKLLFVKGLLLDVDNTLARHFDKEPFDEIPEYLKRLKASGIKLIIVSNARESRVAPFAKSLDLPFEFLCKKPLLFGVKRAMKTLGLQKNEIMLCGDQLFTDILCGNLYGIKTLLVSPRHKEKSFIFKIKRVLEKPFLKKYQKMKESK